MRTSTTARTAALLVAAALTLSLGTGPATARPSSAGDATITTFRFESSVITSRAESYAAGTTVFAFFNGARLPSIAEDPKATGLGRITVNGRVRSTAFRIYLTRDGEAFPGVDIPRGWGSGPVRIDQVRITTTKDGTPATTTETPVDGASNTFYARQNIKTQRGDGKALLVTRKDGRVTVKARRVVTISPSLGEYVSARSVRLQYLEDGAWRTLRTISLDSDGNGTYSRSTTSRRVYRLFIPKTSRHVEFRTGRSGRV